MKNEKHVIERLHKGDPAIIEFLWNEFYESLRFKGIGFKLYIEEIDDVYYESFWAMYNKRLEFNTYKHVRAFLFLTFRNNSFNQLKARTRKNKLYHEYDYVTDQQTTDSYDGYQAALLKKLRENINKLSQQQKTILTLTLHKGLKDSEIAEMLGISVTTVYTTRHEAIKKLRLLFGNDPELRGGELTALILLIAQSISFN